MPASDKMPSGMWAMSTCLPAAIEEETGTRRATFTEQDKQFTISGRQRDRQSSRAR